MDRMCRKQLQCAWIVLVAFFCMFGIPDVCAAAVDSLAMTPSRVNTSPYLLRFQLPTSPTSFAVDLPGPGLFGLNTDVTLNGTVFPNSKAVFFTPAQGGGVKAYSTRKWIVVGVIAAAAAVGITAALIAHKHKVLNGPAF